MDGVDTVKSGNSPQLVQSGAVAILYSAIAVREANDSAKTNKTDSCHDLADDNGIQPL
jgi:hypothetical protein